VASRGAWAVLQIRAKGADYELAMERVRKQMLWRVGGAFLVFLVIAGATGFYVVRRQLPPELMEDIQAGIAARHIPDADRRIQKYLETRYGPLSDPTNREKAFVDFFNLEHIKALQLMVRHSPETQRASNILAMARWVEGYRESLTPQERASLSARFGTPEGRAMLRKATAQYNSQDVYYRGHTAAVISQLLKTINGVQTP
jgi:hypothetical protein